MNKAISVVTYLSSTVSIILFVCSHLLHSIGTTNAIFFGVRVSMNLIVDVCLFTAIGLALLSNVLIIIGVRK